MLKLFSLLPLLVLIFGILGQALPTATKLPSIPPNDSQNQASRPGCSTNAECLRTGQALIKPRRRSPTRVLAPRQSAVQPRILNAVQVTNTQGTVLGYLRTFQQEYLQYSLDTTVALSVSYPENSNGDPVTFTISSSQRPSGFPYIASGANQGTKGSANDLGSGDINYAILTAGSIDHLQGPPYTASQDLYYQINDPNNSPGTETATWIVNPETFEVTPQWTNNDGSEPTTGIVAYEAASSLYLSGDPTVLSNALAGSSRAEIVTFKLVNIPATTPP